jgi:ribonuclease HI
MGTTNNKMELQAVIEALKTIEFGRPIQVFCDSEYVVKGATMWARSWVRNGWMTKQGTPVANKELWVELLELYQLHDVELIHIPGHSGHEWNDYVDQLCTKAMQKLHKQFISDSM